MDEPQFGLSRDEIAFMRMKDFHLQRVSAVEDGDVPMTERDGGILVLHLIPEICVFSRRSLDGTILKEQGSCIRPLGELGGNTRFNVDGFLKYDRYEGGRAYSQLFRDGRLESVMSDVGYPVDQQRKNSSNAIRCGLIERSVFELVHDYFQFCQSVDFKPPIWLFAALVECKGFWVMNG